MFFFKSVLNHTKCFALNTTTLRIRASVYEFGGRKHSVLIIQQHYCTDEETEAQGVYLW